MIVVTGMAGSGKSTFCAKNYGTQFISLDFLPELYKSAVSGRSYRRAMWLSDDIQDVCLSAFIDEQPHHKTDREIVTAFLLWLDRRPGNKHVVVDGMWVFMYGIHLTGYGHRYVVFSDRGLIGFILRRIRQNWDYRWAASARWVWHYLTSHLRDEIPWYFKQRRALRAWKAERKLHRRVFTSYSSDCSNDQSAAEDYLDFLHDRW